MTLSEFRSLVRSALSEHESPADRFAALALTMDVLGYLELRDDRGQPLARADELRREARTLVDLLDERRVPEGRVAIQLALARLDGLREQPARVLQEITGRADIMLEPLTLRASGQVTGTGSGSAGATITAPATGASRSTGTATPTLSAGPPGGTGAAGRQPTYSEAESSGMLRELQAGRERWWEHRHYPLKDGHWGARVHVFQADAGGVSVTPLHPPESAGHFATPEAARAYNAGMAKSYFDVSGGSTPVAPVGAASGSGASITRP